MEAAVRAAAPNAEETEFGERGEEEAAADIDIDVDENFREANLGKENRRILKVKNFFCFFFLKSTFCFFKTLNFFELMFF
jgi:hypothetical protein